MISDLEKAVQVEGEDGEKSLVGWLILVLGLENLEKQSLSKPYKRLHKSKKGVSEITLLDNKQDNKCCPGAQSVSCSGPGLE